MAIIRLNGALSRRGRRQWALLSEWKVVGDATSGNGVQVMYIIFLGCVPSSQFSAE
jgi:hypothetical protein